jgi:hypothetical protein
MGHTTVFTINFLTYQPGGLVPMEFLQVPPWNLQVFVKETNKLKLDAVKQHESSKPHQYYQSRYNHTSQTQLNLFISVVDLNLIT